MLTLVEELVANVRKAEQYFSKKKEEITKTEEDRLLKDMIESLKCISTYSEDSACLTAADLNRAMVASQKVILDAFKEQVIGLED